MPDLKPCPFCGHHAVYMKTTLRGVLYERICCSDEINCGMYVDCGLDDGHIVKQWNRRVYQNEYSEKERQ